MNEYEKNLVKVKALADVNRLLIVDMLSCGGLCGNQILEKFEFTQPTLSHHMKILCGASIVECRRDGKNMYYSLSDKETADFGNFINRLLSNKDDCICK